MFAWLPTTPSIPTLILPTHTVMLTSTPQMPPLMPYALAAGIAMFGSKTIVGAMKIAKDAMKS